ncbi:hypothetical protein niasHT_031433 [Heterodera trifolii]|uniref:Serpin domain-containing protein n=1 Tax=Heterodera trifolii TaxID=157864 RepID=A0ABD2HT05_9BILA
MDAGFVISDPKNPCKHLFMVNEEGTVAAAATNVRIAYQASHAPRQNLRFVADHPFCAFLIRDDSVLFIFSARVFSFLSACFWQWPNESIKVLMLLRAFGTNDHHRPLLAQAIGWPGLATH